MGEIAEPVRPVFTEEIPPALRHPAAFHVTSVTEYVDDEDTLGPSSLGVVATVWSHESPVVFVQREAATGWDAAVRVQEVDVPATIWSFCMREGLQPGLTASLRLVRKCLHGVPRLTFDLVQGMDPGETLLRVTLLFPREWSTGMVVEAYDGFTAQWLEAIPFQFREKIRVSASRA